LRRHPPSMSSHSGEKAGRICPRFGVPMQLIHPAFRTPEEEDSHKGSTRAPSASKAEDKFSRNVDVSSEVFINAALRNEVASCIPRYSPSPARRSKRARHYAHLLLRQ